MTISNPGPLVSLVYCGLMQFAVSPLFAASVAGVLGFGLRAAAIALGLSLPTYKG